jgi:hypothetical protein
MDRGRGLAGLLRVVGCGNNMAETGDGIPPSTAAFWLLPALPPGTLVANLAGDHVNGVNSFALIHGTRI